MSQRKKLKVISSNESTAVVAELARAEEANPRPDPEVRAMAKRRRFSYLFVASAAISVRFEMKAVS